MTERKLELKTSDDYINAFINKIKHDRAIVSVKENKVKIYHTDKKERLYEFDLAEISTYRGLVMWLHHLSEKTWVTKDHLRRLIEVSGVNFYG